MTLHNLFSIPILHYSIDNWIENKNKIMSSLPENKDNYLHGKDSLGGLYTDYKRGSTSMPSYAGIVIDIIKPYLKDFSNQIVIDGSDCQSTIGNKKQVNIEFTDMWYQTEMYGSSHGIHNHGNLGWSSVIYVDYDPKIHTSTEFLSPFHDVWNGNLLTFQPPINEGDMIIFPSYIAHQALPNSSQVPRTVISYNIKGNSAFVKSNLLITTET